MSKTSTHFLIKLVSQAELLQIDVEGLLQVCNIPQSLLTDVEQWVDSSYLAALIRQLWHITDDESLGFEPVPLRPDT